jgi:hypothetical protein
MGSTSPPHARSAFILERLRKQKLKAARRKSAKHKHRRQRQNRMKG